MTHSGGKPHKVGDYGQRFEVTYVARDGKRKIFGWSNDMDGAARMMDAIRANPSMDYPQCRDRLP